MIERGEADYVADGIPATVEGELGAKYGLNSDQFMVSTALQNDYLALNTSRPLFADPRVRRAVSFAIDRPSILRSRGAYAGIVATHLLPPGMPGYRDEHCYPSTGPDLDRARAELPPGFSGSTAIVYTWDTLAGPTIGQIIAHNLKEIGIRAEVLEWPEPEMHMRAARRGEEFDLVASGWTADYPDPYAFLNVLLDGNTIRDQYNANQCYFNEPAYNLRLEAAARRLPPQRYREYGELDLEIMQVAAPLVATDYRTKRDFVAKRVRGAFQHPLYGVDLGALRLDG
jgi:ABC-type transport system substrate-binding protein